MTGLTFRKREEPAERLDLSPLTPSRLAGMAERDIAALAVGTSRMGLRVGDVFDVAMGDAAAIRFLTPRVHREHPLREPERPARRWAAAALAQRMWRRCAASEDAVEMIMAYHGAAPDGPSSPLATKTSY